MSQSRTEALTAIPDDLAASGFSLSDYYNNDDAHCVIDNVLTGKINSFRAFCQVLGWSDLVVHLQDMTPLQGNAVESFATIQNFVIP